MPLYSNKYVCFQNELGRNDTKNLQHTFGRLIASKRDGECSAFVNSCPHRGSQLVSVVDSKPVIMCPFHLWSFDKVTGCRVAAPGMEDAACTKKDLQRVPLTKVGPLYFETWGLDDTLSSYFDSKYVRNVMLEDFTFNREETVDYPTVTSECFLEIYLDGYHVQPVHAGLGNYVDVSTMEWEFGESWSVQMSPANNGWRGVNPSAAWQAYQQQVLKYGWDEEWAALWTTLYPGLMLEYYPYTMVISILVPLEGGGCRNVVQFYYSSEVVNDAGFKQAFEAAYSEVAKEDEDLSKMLQAGRNASRANPRNLPYHELFELGQTHYYAWLDRDALGV